MTSGQQWITVFSQELRVFKDSCFLKTVYMAYQTIHPPQMWDSRVGQYETVHAFHVRTTDKRGWFITEQLSRRYDHDVFISNSLANYPLSVLWHCWSGIKMSIRPVKNLSGVVQMISIWSSWWHCHPSSLASLNWSLMKQEMMACPSGAGLPRLS